MSIYPDWILTNLSSGAGIQYTNSLSVTLEEDSISVVLLEDSLEVNLVEDTLEVVI